MDANDRRECREIGREIVKEAMIEHVKSCPHGRNLEIFQAKIVGVATGCSLLGAASIFGLAKLFGI